MIIASVIQTVILKLQTKRFFNIKEPVATMDKYVTIKKVVVEDKVVPKKRDINLKDPKLKTKGLIQKKKKRRIKIKKIYNITKIMSFKKTNCSPTNKKTGSPAIQRIHL